MAEGLLASSMPPESVQIQTTIHVPRATWEHWVRTCQAQGRDPVAAFNEAIGPLVDQLLLGITAGPQER